jgi:hypothetical protein
MSKPGTLQPGHIRICSNNIHRDRGSGDEISFVEMQNYQGQQTKIVYKGKVSGDEIKFTRTVADMINEDLVAKRAK